MTAEAIQIDGLQHGVAGYSLSRLVEHPSKYAVSQWWTLHGLWRSMQWRGTRKVLKNRDGFSSHREETAFRELLREASFYGAEMPSSYPDLWWRAKDRPAMPLVRPLWRRYGLWHVKGGWQQLLLDPGIHPGPWVHYDIRSAYLWALSMGLPNPRTYRWRHPQYHSTGGNCVHLVTVGATKGAPYPYSVGGHCLATERELETYNLQSVEIHGSLQWDGTEYDWDTLGIVESIRRYSCWKHVARGWWGGLASRHGAVVHYARGGYRELPAWRTDPVWAHLILGRVRERLWRIVNDNPGDVARVYVDSVIVRPSVSVDIGEEIGDWRLEGEYAALHIRNAVHVGPI